MPRTCGICGRFKSNGHDRAVVDSVYSRERILDAKGAAGETKMTAAIAVD